MNKYIFILLTLFLFSSCSDNDEEVVVPNEMLEFIEVEGGYAVKAKDNSISGAVEIPAKYNKQPVIAIADNAFRDCGDLISVAIPSSVATIGEFAFYGSGLTSLQLPTSVTTINQYAFCGCQGLKSVSLPNSVTTLGHAVFESCFNLTEINVDSKNPNYRSVDGVLYNKDITNMIQFPGARETMVIPNTVTSILEGAFYQCANLKSVTIPNSVTFIGQAAFQFCNSLTKITIPASVTSMMDGAIDRCDNLTEVYCLAVTPPEYYGYYSFGENTLTGTLYVPVGSGETYRTTAPWNKIQNIVEINPDDVK